MEQDILAKPWVPALKVDGFWPPLSQHIGLQSKKLLRRESYQIPGPAHPFALTASWKERNAVDIWWYCLMSIHALLGNGILVFLQICKTY